MTITFRAAAGLTGAADTSAPFSAVTFTLPTGHTTDDLLLAFLGWKPYDTTWTDPSGYASEIGPITSGTTGSGVGTGSVGAQVFTKTHSGTESNPSASVNAGAGGYTPALRAMAAFYKTVAGAWTVDSTSGTSETTTLNVNGAGSLAYAAGDMAVVVVVHKDDDATHTSPVLSASGVTFGTLTQQLATTTAVNGDDGAMYVYTASVTTGATAAPNFTATVGASEGWASVIFLRIAEPAAGSHSGAAAVSVAVTATAAGVRTRFGAATAAVAVAGTAAGVRTRFGAATAAVAVAAAATGTATRFGAAAVNVAVSSSATAVRTTFGTAAAAVTITATAAGAVTTFGAAAVTVTLTAAAAGTKTTPLIFDASYRTITGRQPNRAVSGRRPKNTPAGRHPHH
jgi:hypothetical protein